MKYTIYINKLETFFEKEWRSVRLAEVKFSSVEWWSLLPSSGAAFL